MSLLLHICKRDAWEMARMHGHYAAASLPTEGFIHCSTPAQIVATGNRYYKGQVGLVLLAIDEARVESEVKWERATNGELFPHIYGPLNVDAVLQTYPLTVPETGEFAMPVEFSADALLF